jgi:hypothetical protein
MIPRSPKADPAESSITTIPIPANIKGRLFFFTFSAGISLVENSSSVPL